MQDNYWEGFWVGALNCFAIMKFLGFSRQRRRGMASDSSNFNMQDVASGNLAAVGFNPETKQIRIRFVSGRLYEYDDCTQEEADAIIGAPSPNDIFTATIKSGKPYRRID